MFGLAIMIHMQQHVRRTTPSPDEAEIKINDDTRRRVKQIGKFDVDVGHMYLV